MKIKPKHQQRGQSLVEVMAALAVLVIVILALTRVVITSIRNTNFAKDRALATKYAQEAMETVRRHHEENNWPQFIADCNAHSISFDPLPAPFTLEIPDCHLPCDFPPCSQPCTSGDDDICEVAIVVTWQDGSVARQSNLTSQFSRL